VDCSGDVPRVLREGAVTRARIAAVLTAAGIPLEAGPD